MEQIIQVGIGVVQMNYPVADHSKIDVTKLVYDESNNIFIGSKVVEDGGEHPFVFGEGASRIHARDARWAYNFNISPSLYPSLDNYFVPEADVDLFNVNHSYSQFQVRHTDGLKFRPIDIDQPEMIEGRDYDRFTITYRRYTAKRN